MLLSILKSLRALAMSQPPFVTFMFSLLAIVLTVLILALYVNLSGELPNLYAVQSWENFMSKMKDEQFCIVLGNVTNAASEISSQNISNTFESTVLTVRSNLSFSLIHYLRSQPIGHVSAFAGSLALTGWETSCGFSSIDLNDSLLVTLLLPALSPHNDSTQISSCLTITGHHKIFSYLKIGNHSQQCPYAHAYTATAGKLIVSEPVTDFNKEVSSNTHCVQGDSVQFLYDVNVPGTDHFLTVDQRFIISSHLLHGVYLLLALILTLLIFGVVQGRKALRIEHHLLVDKEPSYT